MLAPDDNLILPYNRWLRLLISAVAVIHSFGIHSLGLKLDGILGRLSSSYIVHVKQGWAWSSVTILDLGAKLIAGAISSCAFIGVAVGVGLIFSSLV